jgi:hypothetical protein
MVPELTDKSPIPFGKYKGEKLANVPASYLLWALDNVQLHDNMKRYIEKNKDVLLAEKKRADKQMRR